jgi:hypothetical protein
MAKFAECPPTALRKSPRGKEPVGDDQATAAHYARGKHFLGARERKDKIVLGQSPSP